MGETISSIFAQVCGAVFIFFPVWCLVFLLCSDPTTYSFESRYGELTHELKAEKVMPRLFHFFFTLRRLLLASISIQLRTQPIIQLMLFQLISVLNIAYLIYYQPFIEPVTNRLEIFNEMCILLVGYTLFLYTDFITDFELQVFAGYVMIGIIGFNFLGNLSVICNGMYHKLKRIWKYRLWYKTYLRNQVKQLCASRPKRVPKTPQITTGQEFLDIPEEQAYNFSGTGENLILAPVKKDINNLDNDLAYSLDEKPQEEFEESEYDQEQDSDEEVVSKQQNTEEMDLQMSIEARIRAARNIDKPLPHQQQNPISQYQRPQMDGTHSNYANRIIEKRPSRKNFF